MLEEEIGGQGLVSVLVLWQDVLRAEVVPRKMSAKSRRSARQ